MAPRKYLTLLRAAHKAVLAAAAAAKEAGLPDAQGLALCAFHIHQLLLAAEEGRK